MRLRKHATILGKAVSATARARNIAEELRTLAPDQIRAMLMSLLRRVDIKPDRVKIKIQTAVAAS